MSEKLRKSIRNKLVTMAISVALIAIVLLSIVSWKGFSDMKKSSDTMTYNLVDVAANDSERIVQEQALNELSNIAKATASTVDARIQPIMNQVEILAHSIEELYANPDDYGRVPVYEPSIENEGIYTAQLVYAEYADAYEVADEVSLLGNITGIMNQTTKTIPGANSTHVGTESGILIMSDERSELKIDMGYLDPTTRSWYTNATATGTSTWTEVFVDSYGRGLAITCGHPIYDTQGELKAVVAIGCQLSEISGAVGDVAIGETGTAMVIDSNGDVVMSMSHTLADSGVVLEGINLLNTGNDELTREVEKMIAGEIGIATVDAIDKELFFAYHPMMSIPSWTVITIMNSNEVMQPVLEVREQTTALANIAKEEADKISKATLLAMVAGMGASAVLALLVGILYSNKIASPIRKLEEGVRHIAKGSLDHTLDIKTGDEIENLATAFNIMTSELKHYIEDLTNVTAEKERIGAELEVATHIQSSMLPNNFPAFPQYKEFDIYATMEPAKEVGGDFYDFFLVDEDHLGIVMADVSGKGVPAALFMVIAKTLIQNYAQKGETPADIMAHTNNQLCQGNDANMFVTAWLAIVNIKTGEVSYTNAGHNPPLIKRESGEFDFLPTDPGFVLAGIENMDYAQYSITLGQGDILFLYTDGITEAINSDNELYGDDRLVQKINEYTTHSLKSLLEHIKFDIDKFVGIAPQFDDITMLALKFNK